MAAYLFWISFSFFFSFSFKIFFQEIFKVIGSPLWDQQWGSDRVACLGDKWSWTTGAG